MKELEGPVFCLLTLAVPVFLLHYGLVHLTDSFWKNLAIFGGYYLISCGLRWMIRNMTVYITMRMKSTRGRLESIEAMQDSFVRVMKQSNRPFRWYLVLTAVGLVVIWIVAAMIGT